MPEPTDLQTGDSWSAEQQNTLNAEVNQDTADIASKSAYLGPVSSETEMIALPAAPGDFCFRDDITEFMWLRAVPATSAANWAAPPNTNKGTSKLVVIADNGWGTSLVTNATSTVGTSAARYNVGIPATGITATWNHWYTTFGATHVDTRPAGPISFKAAIKIVSSSNPGTVTGTIYPLTFNAQDTATVAPGGSIDADILGISVVDGDVIEVLTYLVSGTAYPTQKTWGTSSGGGFTAASDLTAPGSAAVTASNGFYFIPSAVLGLASGAGNAPAVFVPGDSIGAGLGDFGAVTTVPKISAGGFIQRALTGQAGIINASVGGDYAQNIQTTNGSILRFKNVKHCNSVILEPGTNDLNLTIPLTAIQLQPILLNIAMVLRRMGIGRVYVITLFPRTTSTDNWATTVNQTPLATEPQRVAHNTWVRAGCPIDPESLTPVAAGTDGAITAGSPGHPFTGFFDTASKVESSLNSGFWKPCKRVTTGSITSGGATITAAGAGFQNSDLEIGGDIGSCFALFGAGASGNPLAMISNIDTVSSPTQCVTGAAATATVTNAQLNIGMVTVDGVHPSSDGHDMASEAIDPALLGQDSTVWTSLPSSSGGSDPASSIPAPSILAKWDTNKNLSAAGFLALETVTAASATPLVLTNASTQIQVITGTTTPQTVLLPTTGVTAGFAIIIINQMSGGGAASVTVQASDGSTVSVQPHGFIGVYRAYLDAPTNTLHWAGDVKSSGVILKAAANYIEIDNGGTATGWFLPASPGVPAASTLAEWDAFKTLSANAFIPLQTSTAASATPITLGYASTQVQAITGTTTAQTVLLPAIAIPLGYEVVIVNQMTTANVTVQASGGTTIATLAPGEMGVFKAAVASPTLATQWSSVVRVPGVVFRAKTGAIVITTGGTQVTYTLPASSTTLLGSGDNAASATKLATARNLDGQPFDGTADTVIMAPATHAATSKSPPVDADELPLADSDASFGLKKLTWANLKAAVKAYYDSVTTALTNKDLTSGTNTFPTLNQSTTGTAAGLSSTLTISSGGTNATTAAAGLANLAAAGIPNSLLPDGIVNANSSAQFVGTVAATSVYIANSQLALPATYLQGMTAPSGSGGTVKCGTTFRWRVALSKNANGTGTFNFLIFRGTNGTTADTADVTQLLGAAMSAVADTLILDIQLTVITTGATGSYYWTITAVHSAAATTGFGLGSTTGSPNVSSGTVSSVAMNTAGLVFGLGYVCGAGGTMPNVTVLSVQAQAFNID